MEPEQLETPPAKNESLDADLGNLDRALSEKEKEDEELERFINTDGRADTPGT